MPGLGCSGPCGRRSRGLNHRQVSGAFEGGQRSWGQDPSRAHLDACGDVVDNADGLGVSEARQRVRDEVELHLPRWLSARLLPIDGLAGGALQAAILGQGRLEMRSPGVPGPLGSLSCSPPTVPTSSPCCHWSTWPRGTAGGTCGRSGPGGPRARAARPCAEAHPHSRMP